MYNTIYGVKVQPRTARKYSLNLRQKQAKAKQKGKTHFTAPCPVKISAYITKSLHRRRRSRRRKSPRHHQKTYRRHRRRYA